MMITPSHNRSIGQNRCESRFSGLDLAHILQLIGHFVAVTSLPDGKKG